jgi:hypothetical protein
MPRFACGIRAPSETKKALTNAVNAPVAVEKCSDGASLPKPRSGLTDTATKSRPISVALTPALAKKKFSNSGGIMIPPMMTALGSQLTSEFYSLSCREKLP